MRLAPERSRRQLLPSPTHATPIDRATWRRQGRKIGVACELWYRAAKKGSLALSGRVDERLSAIEILPLDEGAIVNTDYPVWSLAPECARGPHRCPRWAATQ